MTQKYKWEVDDDLVSCDLDNEFTICVKKTPNGLIIKTFENNPQKGNTGLLYRRYISNKQLGLVKGEL